MKNNFPKNTKKKNKAKAAPAARGAKGAGKRSVRGVAKAAPDARDARGGAGAGVPDARGAGAAERLGVRGTGGAGADAGARGRKGAAKKVRGWASQFVEQHMTHAQAKCAPGQHCAVFGRCGGCEALDVPYERQLAHKQQEIHQLFYGVASPGAFREILGAETVNHYRDKVIAPFVPGKKIPGKQGKREVLTGMYSRGTHKVIPTQKCMLESEVAQDVVRAIMQIVKKFDIEPYNEDTGRGFLRHAVVRVGHESAEVLVTLVTNSREFPHSKSFCRELVRRVPHVTTVVQNINTRQTNVVLGTEEHTLYGPGFILDTLCGLSFRISSQSFYQVHKTQTAALYNAAIDFCALDGTQVVLDAYCGTGTIGLVAAAHGAAHVCGVDSVEAAIHDARLNARHNGIENAQYFAEDATTFMRDVAAGTRALPSGPLVIVMDPPRAGSTPQFIQAACALNPARIVYVSCNPTSQLRDVQAFAKHGYHISAIQPVDMFPHTSHVETVVLLSREEK